MMALNGLEILVVFAAAFLVSFLLVRILRYRLDARRKIIRADPVQFIAINRCEANAFRAMKPERAAAFYRKPEWFAKLIEAVYEELEARRSRQPDTAHEVMFVDLTIDPTALGGRTIDELIEAVRQRAARDGLVYTIYDRQPNSLNFIVKSTAVATY